MQQKTHRAEQNRIPRAIQEKAAEVLQALFRSSAQT